MEKSYLTVGIVAIIIITLVVVLQFLPEKEVEEELSWEDAINLELDSHINNIESCTEDVGCIDSVSTEERDKIESIKDLNGIVICTQDFGDSHSGCSLSQKVSDSCEDIWSLTYKRMGVRPYDTVISIYECNEDYYLLQDWKSAGPSKLSLAKIQLDTATLNKLK